jgi:hypothetical protein
MPLYVCTGRHKKEWCHLSTVHIDDNKDRDLMKIIYAIGDIATAVDYDAIKKLVDGTTHQLHGNNNCLHATGNVAAAMVEVINDCVFRKKGHHVTMVCYSTHYYHP